MADSKALATMPQPVGGDMDKVIAAMVKSRMFSDVKDASQALMKIHMGRALAINDYAAMTGLFMTQNGKIAMTANLMAQIIKSFTPPYLKTPKYRFTITQHDEKACVADVYEKIDHVLDNGKTVYRWEKVGVCSFSEEDAKKAQLTTGGNKGNWDKYKRNMLYARMVSNLAKWYCADAFAGQPAYLPDELPDAKAEVDYETLEVVAVDGKPVEAASAQQQQLAVLIAEMGQDVEAMKKHFDVNDLAKLTPKQIEQAINILEEKKKRAVVS